MDKRIHYRMVLDTETCPMDRTIKDVTPENMLVYDIGWAIVDKKGNVYKTASFINGDIFYRESERMESAYYASKIPMYLQDIKDGKRTMSTFKYIRSELLADIAEYGISEIYAHNARFDVGALNNTMRYLTADRYHFYFPASLTICDTLKMARDTISEMPTYRKYCAVNGYMTKRGQVRLTAEIIYRFINHDETFTESHTGLEDVLIEKEILAYCYRQHKAMRRVLYEGR